MTLLRCLLLLLRGKLVRIVVTGRSMEPTLRDGDEILCERVDRTSELRVGDVVVYRGSKGGPEYAVKRLAALPGDHWSADGTTRVEVDPGLAVVLGDNARVIGDSRLGGPIRLDAIVARMLLGDRRMGGPRSA